MNTKEFAALKVGDIVTNPMMPGSTAEVVETTDKGVHIRWVGSQTRFFYSVNSTAWMHWSEVEKIDEVHVAGVVSNREP